MARSTKRPESTCSPHASCWSIVRSSKLWYDNGKLASVEEYVDDNLRSSRYYDQKGALKEAADYEEDGSKKVKKKQGFLDVAVLEVNCFKFCLQYSGDD